MSETQEKAPDDVLEYLDDLRESGITNMIGAGPFIQRRFKVEQATAHRWLSDWMDSFGDRHQKGANRE